MCKCSVKNAGRATAFPAFFLDVVYSGSTLISARIHVLAKLMRNDNEVFPCSRSALALMSARRRWRQADDLPVHRCAGRRELTDTSQPGCKTLDVPGSIPAPPARRAPAPAARAAASAAAAAVTPSRLPARRHRPAARARRRPPRHPHRRAAQRRSAAGRPAQANSTAASPTARATRSNYAKYQERVAEHARQHRPRRKEHRSAEARNRQHPMSTTPTSAPRAERSPASTCWPRRAAGRRRTAASRYANAGRREPARQLR